MTQGEDSTPGGHPPRAWPGAASSEAAPSGWSRPDDGSRPGTVTPTTGTPTTGDDAAWGPPPAGRTQPLQTQTPRTTQTDFSAAPTTAAVPLPPPPPADGPLVGWDGDGFPAEGSPGSPDSTEDASSPVFASARPRRGASGRVVLLVAVCLVAGLVAGVVGGVVQDRVLTNRTPIAVAGEGTTSRPADSVAGVAAAVLPSTVSIEVRTPTVEGSGSGFVLREDGLILTNNHVVAAAAEAGGTITVVFSDGSQEAAEVVGRTSDYDLAVLRIDRQGLDPLPLGDSDSVVVGDPVIAIGAPLGLQSTVTTGIVSALNRPVSAGGGDEEAAFINAIQTDAAINPGNSGGPLVNLAGEVIGINSAIARSPGTGTGQSGNIGLGFAIPSTQAARTAQQLIDDGRATYPIVGVLLDRAYDGEGVRVVEESTTDQPAVTPGGPAEAAGIQPGDVIVGFNGRPVTDPDQLIVAIRAREPGDTVTLSVRTGEQDERDVDVVLDEAESDS